MNVKRLPVRRLGDVFLGKMIQPEPKSVTDVSARYLRAAHVQPNGRIIGVDDKEMWFDRDELSRHDLRVDDVVIVEGGAGYGRSAVIRNHFDGWGFQNSIVRVRPRSGVSCGRFLDYALQAALTNGEIEIACFTATIPHFTADKVASFNIPAPPVQEQRAIADYLDRETARIDTLIEEQQHLVELLLERRRSVADELLGRTSAVCPLKRVTADITVGIVVNPAAWYAESGVPALRGLNVRPGYINPTDLVYLSAEGDARHEKSRLRTGDVVVVRTGQAGAAAVVPPDLDESNAIDLLIIRPGSKVDPNFLAAYLNAPSTKTQITEGSVGAIQGHFNVAALRELSFPVLGIAEQHDYVEQWHYRSRAIDTLIAETERFIELSRERRSALITAAVTGQIDVRAEVA